MTDMNERVEAALAESPSRPFTIGFAPDGRGVWVLFADGGVLELAMSPEQMHALGVEMVAVAGLLFRPAELVAVAHHPERTQ
jgi:hypothetical protein